MSAYPLGQAVAACARIGGGAMMGGLLHLLAVGKEHFSHPGSKELVDLLDDAGRKAGTSRGGAFNDFLEIVICALSGQQMEDRYLDIVKRYAAGEKGSRGVDSLTKAFGVLVAQMEETRADILGDVFMGGITYGEHGQFLTPENLAELMARITCADDTSQTVCDPCCGSGRLLLAAAKLNPHREFIGQDVDVRCVRMTAINLALHNLYGHVIWGNSLTNERKLVYQTGFNGTGVVREVPIESANTTTASKQPAPEPPSESQDTTEKKEPGTVVQRTLFE